jgi:hypothetical protein
MTNPTSPPIRALSKPLTVLDGMDLLRHRWQDDNIMGDRAPRSIPAALEVGESQRNMAADVPARG